MYSPSDDSNKIGFRILIMERRSRSHHFHGILPFIIRRCHMPQILCFLVLP